MGRVGIARRAFYDAKECGDACGYWEPDGKLVMCVIDGLGHGPLAAAAADAALDCVAADPAQPLPVIFENCDAALVGTRGAAMGIASVDNATGILTYAGVGNTRIAIGRTSAKILTNNNGIVGDGLRFRRLSTRTVPLSPNDLVLMYTDGLKTGIGLGDYGHALFADPQRLAERILQDWRRGTDDAAVLVFANEAH